MTRTDRERIAWVNAEIDKRGKLDVMLDGLLRPTRGDVAIEGAHVLPAWRHVVDSAIDGAQS